MKTNEEHEQNEGPIHTAFLRTPKSDRTRYSLSLLWRHLVDLGPHFGARWILKAPQSEHSLQQKKSQHRMMKIMSKTGGQPNMICLLIVDAKVGGPKWRTKVFRIIYVAN